MAIFAYRESQSGFWRCVLAEPVGGRALRSRRLKNGLVRWWWYEDGGRRVERLVIPDDVSAPTPGPSASAGFPPELGVGARGVATWPWFPTAADELTFPRGADIAEIEDVNGDWWFGTYAGQVGIFPAPYVALVDGEAVRIFDSGDAESVRDEF